ncbi:MAG: signal peptide peptidase SppA [Elusimicrobiales bacterium]|nr:signal peptide peptidase SppA [Elusimicrobiales bacterium]
MEDQNINASSAANAAAQPAAVDKNLKHFSWLLKVTAALFLCSVIAALSLSAKIDSQKKSPADSEKSSISELKEKVSKKTKDGVAVIRVYGVISQSMKTYDWEKTGSSALAQRIRKTGKKKNIKAIVLDINTPGGTVAAVQEIYDAINFVRKEYKKPVVALFGDVSASGGYYIGAACDEIFAHPGTMTGSIGVIMSGMNYEGLMKKIGFKSEVVKSGKYKDIGAPYREMSPEERKLLQDMIDDSYSQFVKAVAEGRKMSDEKVRSLADGRIYTGSQAKEAGLVDKLGNYQDALDRAGVLAGLGKDPHVISGASEPFDNFFSMMNSKFGGGLLSEAFESGPRLEYRLYMK